MTRQRHREPSPRQLRVGEQIRHAIAEILERGNLRDPDLRGVAVTVTEVRISPDLRNATAFVTMLGGLREGLTGAEEGESLIRALARAAPYFRRHVARLLQLKYTPSLRFRFDISFDEATHINELLRQPAVARDLVAGAARDGSDEVVAQQEGTGKAPDAENG